jgi:AcrR family transcriptional regulator
MGVVSPDPFPTRRGGRPTAEEAARLNQAIHECALEQFLAHGYERTSMASVAAAAGTTKASLYARFPSKEAMFLGVLEWATSRPDWPVPEAEPPDLEGVHDVAGLVDVLRDVARAAVARALHPQMVQLTGLAAAHAARFPALAHHSRLSPWRRYELLVDLLRRLRDEEVITTDEDPLILAEHFFGMVSAMPTRLAIFGVHRAPEEQERRTDAAVRFFVAGLIGRDPLAVEN